MLLMKKSGMRDMLRPRIADGFTLLETIVALTILSTALVAIFGSLRACTTANHHGRMLTRAVLLAESKYVDLVVAEESVYRTENGTSDVFHWQVQVAATEIEDLAAVSIIISWQEQQRPQRYQLLSLMEMRSFTETN